MHKFLRAVGFSKIKERKSPAFFLQNNMDMFSFIFKRIERKSKIEKIQNMKNTSMKKMEKKLRLKKGKEEELCNIQKKILK